MTGTDRHERRMIEQAHNRLPGGEPRRIEDLRFLVVDDQPFERWALGTTLTSLGARQVHSVNDGRAAMQMLEKNAERIDVVLCDLDMPEVDGMELLLYIGRRALPVGVIVASALQRSILDSIETVARAHGVQLLGAVRKPLKPLELERLLRLRP